MFVDQEKHCKDEQQGTKATDLGGGEYVKGWRPYHINQSPGQAARQP